MSKASFRQLQRFSASDLEAMLQGGNLIVYVDSQAKFVVSTYKTNGCHADSQASPKLNSEGVKNDLRTSPSDSQAKKEALQGLIASIEGKSHVDSQSEYIPWYKRNIHTAGDRVRMKDGAGRVQVIVVPELDADGRSLWDD